MGYSVVVAAVLLVVSIGNPLAILAVLFVPGYVLVAALFPGSNAPEKTEIDWIERIALSFGLSIVVVPLLGLLLNFTPLGIRFAPIVTTVTLFTVGVGYAAILRRTQLPPDRRLSLTVNLGPPEWEDSDTVEKGLTVALAACVAIAGGTLAYVVLTPPSGKTLTEFYVLGPGGKASDYPSNLSVNETASVIVGIASHEATSVMFSVRIDLVGVRIVYNASSGVDETVEVNRTSWTTFNITLANGQNWTRPYAFRIRDAGLWKVEFLLFKDSAISSTYQTVHILIRVT